MNPDNKTMRSMKSFLVCGLFAFGATGCDSAASINQKALEEEKAKGYAEAKQQNEVVREEGYKEGQVDALTGKIKYRLVENVDRTLTWQSIQFAQTQPSRPVRNRTANDVPYLVPLNDGHGGYVYVPMQDLTEKVEK